MGQRIGTRAGAVLAPLAGGLVLADLVLSPAQYLGLLIPHVVVCTVCMAALRYALGHGARGLDGEA